MRSVPLHVVLKEEKGSRLCHQAGSHYSKLCDEKMMKESVEDCLGEQKFDMHAQISVSAAVSHTTPDQERSEKLKMSSSRITLETLENISSQINASLYSHKSLKSF